MGYSNYDSSPYLNFRSFQIYFYLIFSMIFIFYFNLCSYCLYDSSFFFCFYCFFSCFKRARFSCNFLISGKLSANTPLSILTFILKVFIACIYFFNYYLYLISFYSILYYYIYYSASIFSIQYSSKYSCFSDWDNFFQHLPISLAISEKDISRLEVC